MGRPKKNNANVSEMDEMFSELASDTGGEVLEQLDTVKFFIDTGNLAINYCFSGKFIPGGVPSGRIIEAFGPEASGKTLIASNVLCGCQKMSGWGILLDCENSSNGEFMQKVSHLNLKRIIRYAPPTLEKAFQQIHITVQKIREREKQHNLPRQAIVVVFDSLTVPPLERELRENGLPMDYSAADWKKIVGRQEQPGERAKKISSELRKLQSMVAVEDVTVLIINQVRDKIGILYGSPETTPGGNSLKFYASLRFRTSSKKKIENKALETFSGINMQVKNVKNRMFRPFIVVDDIRLYFEQGIDPLSGILGALTQDERVVLKSNGNYTVAEEYLPDGVTEYKFKAKKVDNTIERKVLLDCPKLLDAKNSEEVQSYLDFWGSGLEAFESGEYEEKDLVQSEDFSSDELEKDA